MISNKMVIPSHEKKSLIGISHKGSYDMDSMKYIAKIKLAVKMRELPTMHKTQCFIIF